MRIADHLSKEQKQQLNKLCKSTSTGGFVNPVKKKIGGNIDYQHLSRKDIEELMGMNRDRYTRRNGAWRRK